MALTQIQAAMLADTAVSSKILPFSAVSSANELVLSLANCAIDFRSTSLGSGSVIKNVPTGALSINIPASATLGLAQGSTVRVYALVAYNGGTPVLCVVAGATSLNIDEATLISPTTISAGSASNGVIYSASSVSANSPFRIVGYVDAVYQSGVGWSTAPSLVQGFGGQAFSQMQSLGSPSQTWQNMTGSRSLGTTYTNTTGKPIQIVVSLTHANSGIGHQIYVGSENWNAGQNNSTGGITTSSWAIVPNNTTYSVAAQTGESIGKWVELR